MYYSVQNKQHCGQSTKLVQSHTWKEELIWRPEAATAFLRLHWSSSSPFPSSPHHFQFGTCFRTSFLLLFLSLFLMYFPPLLLLLSFLLVLEGKSGVGTWALLLDFSRFHLIKWSQEFYSVPQLQGSGPAWRASSARNRRMKERSRWQGKKKPGCETG